jgi:outer membrane protein
MSKKLFYIAFCSLTLFFFAELANAYTIEDAISHALKTNPAMGQAEAGVKAAQYGKLGAYAGFLPVVGHKTDFSKTTQKTLDRSVSAEDRARGSNLSISQSLFNGYATVAEVRKAKAGLLSAQSNQEKIVASIILGAIEVYEEVLTKRDIFKLSESNMQTIAEQRRLAVMRFELGESTRTDIAQADSRYAAAVAERERSMGELLASQAKFASIVGEIPPQEMMPIDVAKISAPAANIEEAIKKAEMQLPDLQIAKFDSQASQEDVNIAISRALPKVNASVAFQKDVQKIRAEKSVRAKVYGLSVEVPIFNAPVYANVGQYKQQARTKKLDFEGKKNNVVSEIITAWVSLDAYKEVLKSTKATVEAAAIALDGVTEEFKLGTRDFLSILNAEQELFNAKVSHRNAESRYRLSLFQLHRLVGTLTKLDMKDVVPNSASAIPAKVNESTEKHEGGEKNKKNA